MSFAFADRCWWCPFLFYSVKKKSFGDVNSYNKKNEYIFMHKFFFYSKCFTATGKMSAQHDWEVKKKKLIRRTENLHVDGLYEENLWKYYVN